MNRYARLTLHRLPHLGVGVFLAAFVPRASLVPRLSQLASVAVGVTAGAILFGILARCLRPPPLAAPHVARTVGLLTPRVAVGALVEETFWRYLVLCSLIAPLGLCAAVLTTTAAFALAHLHQGVRRVRVHLLTGATFAYLYVGSGHLAAAIAAHASYNLLVIAATTAWAHSSVAVESTP
jgi:membrane protease YdiL (CAAX protease family)